MDKQEAIEQASTFEWAQLFHSYSVAVIVPIVLAYFGYKSLKAKVDAHNREKKKELQRKLDNDDTIDWENAGPETILSWTMNKLKERK